MLANVSLEVKHNSLYVRYYYEEKKTLFNTGIEISSEYCDKKQNLINQNHPDASKLNYQINLLIEKIQKAVVILEHQGVSPTPSEVRSIVLNIDSSIKKADFFTYFDNFVSKKEKTTRSATRLNYQKLRNHLINFQEKCN